MNTYTVTVNGRQLHDYERGFGYVLDAENTEQAAADAETFHLRTHTDDAVAHCDVVPGFPGLVYGHAEVLAREPDGTLRFAVSQWFVTWGNRATLTRQHPSLGAVAICEPCNRVVTCENRLDAWSRD